MQNNSSIGQELREAVREAQEKLQSISVAKSEKRPAPDKWSSKEIIGHLIDSASNNHQRFVRAQFQDHMIFPAYDQEGWVDVQHYMNSDWYDLIELWTHFNLHLAQVIDHVPDTIRHYPHIEHNLDHIAWKKVPEDQPATLEYFMADYVGHLKHHLRQIWDMVGI